ncbi:protein-disulfide reductase DsbD [Pasteurella bettyae]|uniref:Thiol:disulfide interchange protein DsbD n=1 Tax=Pasteurella bettyae CCUG 2042 TaxID=1095749 RepID=I3DEJ9_9PAST|nr:protein-disulfide reductase DsbD [Pasteurella bettyae]EIJ70142.1 thiol:disulfide interchange protein DsbD [Pasteurella bettyae CCUG 2042]SUB21957.1 thiol:disulfide interchange protein [Pasteurella bettyae]
MKHFLLLLTLFFVAITAKAGLFDKHAPLKVDEAFIFSAEQNQQQVNLHWQIADGYYLYKKEIHVEIANMPVKGIVFPAGESHKDEFFGEVEIFTHHLTLAVPIKDIPNDSQLSISYQGCTEGFCYPPETKLVNIKDVLSKQISSEEQTLSEQDHLAQQLSNSKYSIFWFFILGLGLAFTPCVLPMLPLLSAIVIGHGQRPSTSKALFLSFVYVQGMALTYTLLGLIVALIGLPFQVALQSPYVLIGLSILFIILSLSMFGLFELQLPVAWQTKLTLLSQKQKGGVFSGVFIMGMISGLVASPCTTAPLSGVLLYVAQSGDLLTGGITLYLLALGMGLPLMLITVFGNKILPKSGSWMIIIKELFGFVLLLLPVFLLIRVFPNWEATIIVIWLIAFCCWVSSKRYWVGLLVTFIIFFSVNQFSHFPFTDNSAVGKQKILSTTSFQVVSSYDELQQLLKANPKSIAMLDLYADWCVACKEFEKYTFSDPRVQQNFENILLLQADMTENSSENIQLMKKLNVLGLPTIIFFDQNAQEIENSRITGFMDAESFLKVLKPHLMSRSHNE